MAIALTVADPGYALATELASEHPDNLEMAVEGHHVRIFARDEESKAHEAFVAFMLRDVMPEVYQAWQESEVA